MPKWGPGQRRHFHWLYTAKRRIDFTVTCGAHRLACPQCAAPEQSIHDRVDKQWRHLDFFQFEAWLHAKVPRVKCTSCGKTTQLEVPWARPGSGFTMLDWLRCELSYDAATSK